MSQLVAITACAFIALGYITLAGHYLLKIHEATLFAAAPVGAEERLKELHEITRSYGVLDAHKAAQAQNFQSTDGVQVC